MTDILDAESAMFDRRSSRLFDSSAGILGRAAFTDQAIFDEEMERIFGRAWVFVAHESQIPNPNDFVSSKIGIDNVVVTRDREGDIHVLLNTCRHKGMRVVRYDEGNTPVFTCPYHAWSYSTNGNLVDTPGQLVAVQRYKQSYDGKLDKKYWGLVAARVMNYKGMIFATWSDDAPSFEEYIGGAMIYLDALLDTRDGRPGGSTAVAGVMKWRFNANWKSATENFIGDGIHGVSHRSVELVGIGPGGPNASRHGRKDSERERTAQMSDVSFPRFGHGILGVEPTVLGDDNYDTFPVFESPSGPLDNMEVVEAYFRQAAKDRLERHRGEMQVYATAVGGLFPNLSFHPYWPRTIAVWHPISPTVTEGWRWLLVDEDAPKEVNDLARHHFMRYSGPAGLTEQDDMENWSYLTEASAGTQAQKYPYNYQARLHANRKSELIPDAYVTDEFHSEGGIRAYYTAWQRHMGSDSWAEYLEKADEEQ